MNTNRHSAARSLSLFGLIVWLNIGLSQTPSLHIYLNTPNCYAHSMGVIMLDSIDDRCLKELVISERARSMYSEALTVLGLSPQQVSLRTLPQKQFNKELWMGGFSRFVFGMGKDTIYDTNLDYLFQYADSINQRIAAADPGPLLALDPPLMTSGSISSTLCGPGHVQLLDDYLNRMTVCTVDGSMTKINTTTYQLPSATGEALSTELAASNIFDRQFRNLEFCPATPNDGRTHLLGLHNTGNFWKGDQHSDAVLVTIDSSGAWTETTIVPSKGFGVAASSGGTIVGDTLYTEVYRKEDDARERLVGTFVRKGTEHVHVKSRKGAMPFPAWIQKKLEGNFSNGFYSGTYFHLHSMPLIYHAPTARYVDIGPMLELSLDTAVAWLARREFRYFYVNAARTVGAVTTVVYQHNAEWWFARIDIARGVTLHKARARVPNGYSLAMVLYDADHLLMIELDQLHARIIPLE